MPDRASVNFLLSPSHILVVGYSYDKDCIYINGTGDTSYTMLIQLNKCGTLGSSDHTKKRDVYKNSQPTVSERTWITDRNS